MLLEPCFIRFLLVLYLLDGYLKLRLIGLTALQRLSQRFNVLKRRLERHFELLPGLRLYLQGADLLAKLRQGLIVDHRLPPKHPSDDMQDKTQSQEKSSSQPPSF